MISILEKDIEIYTVSQLNQTARSILEGSLDVVWVQGEISNLARPSSGHWYFSLKDAQCQVRCAMFNGRNKQLRFDIENGMQVLARAAVSLYEARGEFQLIVEQIEPAGSGALQLAFEQLKQKLMKEGLFAEEHKKLFPEIPKTIGVVTSPTGAAIHDILSVLKRRFPLANIIIYPTAVQGAAATPQIVQAIQTANRRQECDVLILTRGGGSLEDLWCFNEESVARAIYNSQLPIITGIGHEVDFTIADFVADHRAPTPSAAAEFISPDQKKLQTELIYQFQKMQRCVNHQFIQLKKQLEHLVKRLRHPAQIIREKTQQLDFLEKHLVTLIEKSIQHSRSKLQELVRALDAVSPLATLQRGYAIVYREKSQEVVYQASQVKPGEKIQAKLSEGDLLCTVDEITID